MAVLSPGLSAYGEHCVVMLLKFMPVAFGCILSLLGNSRPFPGGCFRFDQLYALYRKVTTWARLQPEVGPKWVASRPAVMPFSTAQRTGL